MQHGARLTTVCPVVICHKLTADLLAWHAGFTRGRLAPGSALACAAQRLFVQFPSAVVSAAVPGWGAGRRRAWRRSGTAAQGRDARRLGLPRRSTARACCEAHRIKSSKRTDTSRWVTRIPCSRATGRAELSSLSRDQGDVQLFPTQGWLLNQQRCVGLWRCAHEAGGWSHLRS